MSDKQKQFFREATKAQIKRKTLVDFTELGELPVIASLEPHEYTIVPLYVPEGFRHGSKRKFMKHGPEVKLRRAYTLKQAVAEGLTPVRRRVMAFDSIKNPVYCSYSDQPISEVSKDQRKRKIPLTECLEGARLLAYSSQSPGTFIKVKSYSDAERARIEGAEVVITVPSRTDGGRRYELKLMSVPIVDSPEKYGIVLNLSSDHTCASKRFSIRYKYLEDKESSRVFNFCAHEIAGYLKLVEQEWNENKNIIPLQMCPFAIPTQETVDYYLKWENNVLIYDPESSAKDKLRKPNQSDKEIGLWALVHALKHDRTFFARDSIDGPVKKYNWGI